jgi:hypothetical protein
MSSPRSTAPEDWAPSRAWINIGPQRPGGLQSPAAVVGIFKDSSLAYGQDASIDPAREHGLENKGGLMRDAFPAFAFPCVLRAIVSLPSVCEKSGNLSANSLASLV